MEKNTISVFDFFSGCGGTSQGFKTAGLEVVFGLDFDKNASASFQSNFPDACFINEDITKLDVTCIDKQFSSCKEQKKLTLFSGCAPCQPFSKQNRNRNSTNNDPRVNLLSEFSRFVRYYLPDFVFIENVPGMQSIKTDSSPFQNFLQTLGELGYDFDYGVVSAIWFGVPQDRKRLILMASKHGKIKLPSPIFDGVEKPYPVLRDWIGDLPKINHGESDPNILDHKSASLSELNLLRIRSTPEGGDRDSWPESLHLACHSTHKGHKDVYGRLSWDKPSSVLTTRCTSYSNGRFGHPDQDRALSLREAALKQTFPLQYNFHGTFNEKAKQIGNAVPPLMAQAVGEHFLSHINH